MLKRILTGLIALPFFLFFLLSGKVSISILTVFISIVGLYEFYEAINKKYDKPIYWVGYLVVICILLGIYLNFEGLYFLSLMYIAVIFLLAYNLFSKSNRLMASAMTILGVIYIGIGFSHLMLLEELNQPYLLLIPFIICWGTDTFAYFTGKFFGRKKLFPRVSPKKTIEGALGGIIGSVLINYIFVYFFIKDILLIIIIISLFGSVLSQIGDLIASKIKRICGIKDFGNILPGHGGIIDRFDSALITIPFVYYCVYLYFNILG